MVKDEFSAHSDGSKSCWIEQDLLGVQANQYNMHTISILYVWRAL